MSRVASEPSLAHSLNQGHGLHSRAASPAKKPESPFADLLDGTDDQPSPSRNQAEPPSAGAPPRTSSADQARSTRRADDHSDGHNQGAGVDAPVSSQNSSGADPTQSAAATTSDAEAEAALGNAGTDPDPTASKHDETVQAQATVQPVAAAVVLPMPIAKAEDVAGVCADDSALGALDDVAKAAAAAQSKGPHAQNHAGPTGGTAGSENPKGQVAAPAAEDPNAPHPTAELQGAAHEPEDGNPELKAAHARQHAFLAHNEETPKAPEASTSATGSAVPTGTAAPVEHADGTQLINVQQPMDRSGNVASATVQPSSGAANAPAAVVPVSGLAVEIASRAQAGRNRFEIRLDPPELGRIDVRLDVDHSGHVTSRLVVEKAETLDMLRRDSGDLERALQQAGLKTSDNGLQFTLRDQSFAGRDDNGRAPAQSVRTVMPDPEIPASLDVAGYGRILRAGGGVDIRV